MVVVIPARGGSRGIPRKNLLKLGGRELVARAVDCARAAQVVDCVLVSTDDAQIATVAGRAGAQIVRRPAELAGDEATSESAVLHALDELRRAGGPEPELTVLLQCTSPLTLPQDIDGTVRMLVDSGADCALAAASFHHFIWRIRDGSAVGVNHDPARRLRRQELPPQYLEAGSVYAMRTSGLRTAGRRFFGSIAVYEVPRWRVLEIDAPEDVRQAEALLATVGQRPSRELAHA